MIIYNSSKRTLLASRFEPTAFLPGSVHSASEPPVFILASFFLAEGERICRMKILKDVKKFVLYFCLPVLVRYLFGPVAKTTLSGFNDLCVGQLGRLY